MNIVLSIAVWATIAMIATVGILTSDFAASLQQLGCLINGTCTSNS